MSNDDAAPMDSLPVGESEERMTTKPSAAAMRAAEKIADMYAYSPDADQLRSVAEAIDRETGLPALIAACERWIALRARCDAPGAGWACIDREIEDGISAEIEAALAKVRIA